MERDATSFSSRHDEPMTRKLGITLFKHLGIASYWQDGNAKKDNESNRDDQFVSLSDLRKQEIRSPGGKPLGSIDDVVLSQETGQIVYVLFSHGHTDGASEAKRVFPIPLAAFVMPTRMSRWTLALTEAILDNTETIKDGRLPKEMSRAWVEYIHVRYGGGVFDGVQRQPKQK